jgi:hypothetical protein
MSHNLKIQEHVQVAACFYVFMLLCMLLMFVCVVARNFVILQC